MSTELYTVLALAARYLFAFLGVLIVIRSFLWLLSDRADLRRRMSSLPDAGFVGELVVLSGDPLLREGTAIAVPWEGVLGSVRSCDICVPASGVARKHLSFSFQPGEGIRIRPYSGKEAMVDGVPLTVRSHPESAPLRHGSVLQLGPVVLRLRLFAGLDPRAGFPADVPSQPAFDPAPGLQPIPQPTPQPVMQNIPQPISQTMPQPVLQPVPQPMPQAVSQEFPPVVPADIPPAAPPAVPFPEESPPREWSEMHPPAPPSEASPDPNLTASGLTAPTPRRRRRDHWEVDWSE